MLLAEGFRTRVRLPPPPPSLKSPCKRAFLFQGEKRFSPPSRTAEPFLFDFPHAIFPFFPCHVLHAAISWKSNPQAHDVIPAKAGIQDCKGHLAVLGDCRGRLKNVVIVFSAVQINPKTRYVYLILLVILKDLGLFENEVSEAFFRAL